MARNRAMAERYASQVPRLDIEMQAASLRVMNALAESEKASDRALKAARGPELKAAMAEVDRACSSIRAPVAGASRQENVEFQNALATCEEAKHAHRALLDSIRQSTIATDDKFASATSDLKDVVERLVIACRSAKQAYALVGAVLEQLYYTCILERLDTVSARDLAMQVNQGESATIVCARRPDGHQTPRATVQPGVPADGATRRH